MKKTLFTMFLLVMAMSLFAVYEVGDIVQDFSWEHSDGVNPRTTTSINELLDEQMAIVLEFSQVWCAPCNAVAPHLEEVWEEHGGMGNTELYICAALTQNADGSPLTWEQLDGEAWRDVHGVTHWLAMEELYSHSGPDFGVTGIPHAVVIGNGGVLLYSGHPAAPEFEEAIDLAIATFTSLYVSGSIDDVYLAAGESTTISIDGLFSHGAGNPFDVELTSYDNNICEATLEGTDLTITALDTTGSTDIVLTATSGEETVTYSFMVDVHSNSTVQVIINMHDSYGDGWGYNGAINYIELAGQQITLEDGTDGQATLFLENGYYEYTYYENDGYGAENSWTIELTDGTVLSEGQGTTNGGGSASATYNFTIGDVEEGTVSGYVTNLANNEAIAGATISIGTQSVTSEANGYYEISTFAGEKTLVCTMDGYYTVSHTIEVVANETTALDFNLEMISNAPNGLTGTFGSNGLLVTWNAPGNQALTTRDVVFDQPVIGPDASWGFSISDAATNYSIADNFTNVFATVSSVSFYGICATNASGSWEQVTETPASFDITIYEDNNGEPGEEIFTTNAEITGTLTGDSFQGFDGILYTYNFETPLYLDNGWISIVGTTVSTPTDGYFMWGYGNNGDGVCFSSGASSTGDYAFSFEGDFNLTGYKVMRNDELLAEVGHDVLYYNDTTAESEQTYTYVVVAVYVDGTEVPSLPLVVSTTSTDDNITPVNATVLNNNYPNPFNPVTNISFTMAEEGNVTIDVYNMRGQKVKTLINENVTAGNHVVTWTGDDENGQSVSSGVYFYKMKSGRYSSTKKMILLK